MYLITSSPTPWLHCFQILKYILSPFLYLIHHHENAMSNEAICFDCGFLFIYFILQSGKGNIDREREGKRWCHLPRGMGPAPPCCASLLTLGVNGWQCSIHYLPLPKFQTAQLFPYELSTEESCHSKAPRLLFSVCPHRSVDHGQNFPLLCREGRQKQITSPMDD